MYFVTSTDSAAKVVLAHGPTALAYIHYANELIVIVSCSNPTNIRLHNDGGLALTTDWWLIAIWLCDVCCCLFWWPFFIKISFKLRDIVTDIVELCVCSALQLTWLLYSDMCMKYWYYTDNFMIFSPVWGWEHERFFIYSRMWCLLEIFGSVTCMFSTTINKW